jgi:hypothetical protein
LPLHGTSKTIGSIVRGFKIGVTKWIRQHTDVYDVWQRNFYERIIRNETELNGIRNTFAAIQSYGKQMNCVFPAAD